MEFVSVLIPAWDSAAWLGEAIESALAQTHPRSEVVAVDDRPTDGTSDALRSFGKRIRGERTSHRGAAAARNRLLELARGEWAQYLDADDRLWDEFRPCALTLDLMAPPVECMDEADNDGDGLADYPDNPGFSDATDHSEQRPDLPCDDGADNDSDGYVDFRIDGNGEPGCRNPEMVREEWQCQDGINNDPGADPDPGLIDFDRGQSIHGHCSGGVCPPGVSDPDGDGGADPDPQCFADWNPVGSDHSMAFLRLAFISSK